MKKIFFQECDDLLIETENGLLSLDQGDADPEMVNAVFRAVHSIKGGAGAFGLDSLVSFAHVFETTLDAVRSNSLEPTPDVVRVFLRAGDVLSDLASAAQAGEPADMTVASGIMEELSAFLGSDASEEDSGEDEVDFAPMTLDMDFDDDDFFGGDDDADEETVFEIEFTPAPSLYARANDPLRLLRNLAELGALEVECDASKVPPLEELDPNDACLSWSMRLTAACAQEDIEEVFEFVEGDCELSIRRPVQDITASPVEADDDEATHTEPDVSVEEAGDDAPVATVDEPSPSPATVLPTAVAPKQKRTDTTIRVSLDRIERLVNLTGELVINQAMLAQSASAQQGGMEERMEKGLEELKQLTREIQESVMSIRAQPVSTLFQRMSRIVREAAQATGKTIRLITEGEATEVDKTVIERLADPLTHMIRNAVDHGLEVPEERLASGKSEEGVIVLSAAHRSGRVIIEVRDDGAGVDRERVRQKAIEKGLISETDQLSDSEIDNLLFMPGFSTASEVSNLSGRGVGMDVVRSSIQSIGGKVSIFSEPGKGATFTISLPLTLAILDGMLVEIAGQVLVVPLTSIIETLKPASSDIHAMGPDSRVISVRGELIPIIDVAKVMAYRSQSTDPLNSVVLSVEVDSNKRAALLVDRIQDQRQVVIKSLGENFGSIDNVAAATILGDGRIALILDIESIIDSNGLRATAKEARLAATG